MLFQYIIASKNVMMASNIILLTVEILYETLGTNWLSVTLSLCYQLNLC